MCNKHRGRKQGKRTHESLKRREEKRRALEDAEYFSKVVMGMI